ncbi:MAG TPA: hypothetical protein VG737_07210, partial [Cyclobacteriaceae bacterium]|nr:hypothetical protein [Cyclobacteriaceae bacterium]
MDIFIKSFNRPFYLERCLRSVFQFITGNFKVTILDDGTPPVYLAKISALFPDVTIRKSDQYTEKVSALGAHANKSATFSLTRIPTNLWRTAISESSSVFLLLEEDAWLTESIDVDNIETVMKECGLVTVKIGWNGSPLLVEGEKVRLTDSVEQLIPPTPSVPGIIERVLLTNTFKIRSVLQRLSLVNSLFTLPYYSRYTITSAFFDKQYWLWIWENAGDRINEGEQL